MHLHLYFYISALTQHTLHCMKTSPSVHEIPAVSDGGGTDQSAAPGVVTHGRSLRLLN